MAVEMRVRIRWDVQWEGRECGTVGEWGCSRAENWDGTLDNKGEWMGW